MASNKAVAAGEQTIEQLQKRYEGLNNRRIRAESDLANAKRQLDALQQEAREKYGTDDVAQLRQKLAEMKAENETKRSTYQADLDRIEAELQQVEQAFVEPGGNGEPA
jgi:chromosome segregation ATPase